MGSGASLLNSSVGNPYISFTEMRAGGQVNILLEVDYTRVRFTAARVA